MKKIINKIYDNPRWQLVVSIVLAVLCIGVSYLTHGIYWDTSDDPGVINVISGKYSGTPTFSFPFLNAFLGHFFAALYSVTTLIPWYSIFHLIIKFVSLVVIFWLTLLVLNKKQIRWFVPVLSCVFLFLSVWLYPTVYMSFTTTATVSGCAATALLFIAHNYSDSKWRYVQYALSALLMIISFMVRYQCGLVAFCFWALMMAYITVKAFQTEKRRGVKRGFKLVVTFALILAIGVVQNSASFSMKENYEPDGYLEYNSYRSKYIDYTTASFDTSAEFYEEIGWDEDLYRVSKSWYFLDSRFNLEALKAINEETVSGGYGSWTVKEGIASIVSLVLTNRIAMSLTVVAAAIFVFIFIEFLFSKPKKKSVLLLLLAMCAVGGAGMFCLYQCIQGRFLLRVYQTIMFPAIIILYIIALDLFDKKAFEKHKKMSGAVVSVLVVIAILISGISTLKIHNMRKSMAQPVVSAKQMLVDYAKQYPENLYVNAPFATSYRAFTTYDPETIGPRNVMGWGGCGMYSQSYYDFLKLHGYDSFYTENLYDENVYLVLSARSTRSVINITSYLNNNFGPTDLVEIYRTEEFVVYDVNHSANGVLDN